MVRKPYSSSSADRVGGADGLVGVFVLKGVLEVNGVTVGERAAKGVMETFGVPVGDTGVVSVSGVGVTTGVGVARDSRPVSDDSIK